MTKFARVLAARDRQTDRFKATELVCNADTDEYTLAYRSDFHRRFRVRQSCCLIVQHDRWRPQALINSNIPIYVTDSSPTAKAMYHARFNFSPNSIVMGNNKTYDIFVGRSRSGATIFHVQLRYSSGNYRAGAILRANSGSKQSTSWYTLTNTSHTIEISWQAATTLTTTDGELSLWLDGSLK